MLNVLIFLCSSAHPAPSSFPTRRSSDLVFGPPDMPKEALAWYQDLLKKVADTPEFKDYMQQGALKPAWLVGDDFKKDRKSTRLNSSHLGISYAVFCLKKKNNYRTTYKS